MNRLSMLLHKHGGVQVGISPPPPPPPPPPPSLAPTLRNVSVNMGDHTNKNSGGVFLKNLGLTAPGSAAVSYWRVTGITANGGTGLNSDLLSTCTSNVANSSARTPMPQLNDNSHLTQTLFATSYTMTVTGVGSDSSEATCTLTFNVVANAFNRGDDGNRDGVDAMNAWKTEVGGLTMLISTGADYSSWGIFDLKALAPASGRLSIRYADQTRPSQIPLLDCVGISKTDIYSLGIGGAKGNKVAIRDNNGTLSDDVHCYDFFPLGASISDVNIGGTAGNGCFVNLPASGCTNSSFERGELWWGGRGLLVGGNNQILNSTVRYCYGDGGAGQAGGTWKWNGNTVIAPMRDTDISGSPDHVDMFQGGGASATVNCEVKGNCWIQADGTGGAGGFQSDGIWNGVLYANNILLQRTPTGGNWGLWNNGIGRDSTIFLTGSGKISQAGVNANDDIWYGQPLVSSSGGTGNLLARVWTTGQFGLDAGWTVTTTGANASRAEAVSYPNVVQYPYSTTVGVTPSPINYEPDFAGDTHDFSNVLNFANARERLDNYNPSTNPNGTDYPNMTCVQIVARVVTILTPKAGGALDLGGGACIGGIGLNGLQKVV